MFKYTNAAGRRSGSQNAASSFRLNSGDTNPKDVVTDGTSFWVVDDGSSTDNVFKYTLSGSLLGSWTLGAGSSPTGITLDPTNVSNLWIVDSGTDRVYQYDNAASRTSGSQSPSRSFALDAGNTNPQGIADPPSGTPVPSRARPFTGAYRPSGDLAALHGKSTQGTWTPKVTVGTKGSGGTLNSWLLNFVVPTMPGGAAAAVRPTPTGGLPAVAQSPLWRTVAPPSALGPEGTPVLIPLTPAGDQDLTLLATELIRSGTKRRRPSLWG